MIKYKYILGSFFDFWSSTGRFGSGQLPTITLGKEKEILLLKGIQNIRAKIVVVVVGTYNNVKGVSSFHTGFG